MKGIDNMSIAGIDNIISKNYTINLTQAEILGLPVHVTLLTLHGLQGLVAIVVNLFTIIAVYKFHYLREDCACRFVASLACADLLAGVAVFVDITLSNVTAGPSVTIALCRMLLFLHFVSIFGNAYNILCITIERFIYIIKPLRYPSIVTQYRTSVIIPTLWSAIITYVIVLHFFGSSIEPDKPCQFFQVLNTTNRTIVVIQFVLIFSIVIPCHVKIIQTVQRLRRNDPHLSHLPPDQQTPNEQIRQRKMAITMSLVLGTFLFCYIPGLIYNIVISNVYRPPWSFTILLCQRIFRMVLWIQTLSNAFIYGWRNKLFRRAYRKLLHLTPNQVDPQDPQEG